MITLQLPVCPSTNALFANVRGKGRVKTADYKAWLRSAHLMVSFQLAKLQIRSVPSPVTIQVRIGKVNEARDADNFNKAVGDLLTAAGIIQNDNLKHVYQITAARAFDDVQEGWMQIVIKPYVECAA